jgi:serine/threonine protein kinase
MATSEPQSRLTFQQAAIRSGLISADKYDKVIKLGGTDDRNAVAATLIKSGVITEYQAQQLAEGRTKFTLGPYLITDLIGEGGMGQVFKAVHKVMGRECAVKVLPLEKSTNESRSSFRREVRMQAGLDCPYLVRAYDAGKDGSVHYLVTEYIPGRDLRRLIRRNGPLSMGDAASVISQSAIGLQYAHEQGMVHRDVKPGNILVTPDGHAKVSDIGLATWSMGLADDPRAGKIVGTADYLSPEQVRDPMSVGPLSDIYSLGCTLYYTVTGKVPYPGGDSREKCRQHCEQTPLHPRRISPDLQEEFVDILADMMEKDPGRRIQSAGLVAEYLEPWVSAATDTINVPVERSAWTPPPPPHEPSQIREILETPEFASSGNLTGSGVNFPSLPDGWEAEPAPRFSHVWPIAIALAIVVPLSLLVGAIIGFIVRGLL